MRRRPPSSAECVGHTGAPGGPGTPPLGRGSLGRWSDEEEGEGWERKLAFPGQAGTASWQVGDLQRWKVAAGQGAGDGRRAGLGGPWEADGELDAVLREEGVIQEAGD